MKVVEAEAVPYVPDGVEAVVFTADGDMRQALNNIQATHSGFGYVNQENVFKVCDQPHPQIIADAVAHCLANNVDDAYDRIKHLYVAGFSAMDIIGTVYRVVKNYNSEAMPEFVKLEMIREIGFAHMRVGDGVNSLLQMAGLCAKLCKVARAAKSGVAAR
jgi:replication factor C subunit 2/4